MTSAKTTRPLKILISRNSAGAVGGAELSALDQAIALKELGHQPVLVTGLRRLRERLPAGIRSYGWLRVELGSDSLRHLRLLVLTPFSFLQATYYAWWLRPDVINPHSREDQVAFTLTRLLHRRPVVWKDPGDLRHKLQAGRINPLAWLNQKLLEAAIRRADHIYMLNRTDIDLLLDKVKGLSSDKLTAIPSSILFSRYDRQAAHPKSRALVIGTILMLHRSKGVQDLIRALPKGDNLELWIIGDGPYRSELEKLTGDDKRVRFFGQQADVSPYLATIDIFVQPAHQEPWGRNVKEAMHFGKAIIGSDIGGIAAQISDGKTGLLYKAGDVKELAQKLKQLIDDAALRQKLGQAAQTKAAADGDFIKIVAKQILPIYQRYIKREAT